MSFSLHSRRVRTYSKCSLCLTWALVYFLFFSSRRRVRNELVCDRQVVRAPKVRRLKESNVNEAADNERDGQKELLSQNREVRHTFAQKPAYFRWKVRGRTSLSSARLVPWRKSEQTWPRNDDAPRGGLGSGWLHGNFGESDFLNY